MTPAGKVTKGVVGGLTTAIDVAFAPDGTMYVLQYAGKFNAQKLRYIENTGALFRIGKDGSKQPIVTRLMFPTAMEFGSDGALYITNFGNEANFGEGQVLRVVPGQTSVVAPEVPDPRVKGSYDIPSANPGPAAGDTDGRGQVHDHRAAGRREMGLRPHAADGRGGSEDRRHQSGPDRAHRDLDDGRIRHGDDPPQQVRRAPDRRARDVQADLHAAPVDEGDDRRDGVGGRPDRDGRGRPTRPWSTSRRSTSPPSPAPSA